MATTLQDSIASLDLASLHAAVVDTAEIEIDILNDMEKAETVSREDLMGSFSKFDSLVGSMDVVADNTVEDEGSVDTMQKFLDHYEAAQSDITANLRAFQSNFEANHELPGKEEEQGKKKKKGLGKKKRSDRKDSVERKHSVERRIEEAKPKPKEIATSPAGVQDIPDVMVAQHIPPAREDLTGMFITINRDENPLNGCPPRKTPKLPDPSTMSAKEILKELGQYSDKKPDFIEKSEMIKALVEARANKGKPMERKVPKAVPNDAPRTPRASRSRGRSTEPSPRSKTASPIRAHLRSLKDLMDLDISDTKEPETPRRGRRKKGLKKVRSSSLNTFDVDEKELESLKRSSSWWNLTGGRDEEGSKNSKSTKSSTNSKRKKGLRRVLSNNDIGVDGETKFGKSKANGDAFDETPKRRNRSLKMGRSKSPITFDDPELEALKRSSSWWNLTGGARPEESSKSSKESKNSRRKKKGLRKVRSSNDIDADDDNLLSDTPRRRRKKSLRKSLSNPTLEADPPHSSKSSKANAKWDLGVGGGAKKKRKPSLRRSSSNPELDVEDDSKGSNRSNRRKNKGLKKASSGSKLDIDGLVFAKSKKRSMSLRKPNSGSKLDIDALVTGKSKDIKKRSMSMRKARSGPTLDMGVPREIFATSTTKSNSTWDLQTGGSQYKEQQSVWYTSSSGEKERAVILKIHLDDGLIPFYDIQLSQSGKEKQTDDAHLSPMIMKPRRSKSVDRATAATNMMRHQPSPVSARRRLKTNPNNDNNGTAAKSPVSSIRKKMSSCQSPGTLRKAYRVL